MGTTPVGRATVRLLRLNREELINLRTLLVMVVGYTRRVENVLSSRKAKICKTFTAFAIVARTDFYKKWGRVGRPRPHPRADA